MRAIFKEMETDEKNNSENDVIEPEIVESLPMETKGGSGFKIHALSALLVIGLDTMLFAGNAATFGLGTIFSVLGGFTMAGVGVTLIEKFFGNESLGKSVTKGFLLGILTGIPTPIAGTAVGALILALGGVKHFQKNSLLSSSENNQDKR